MEQVSEALQKRIKDREAVQVKSAIKGYPEKMEEPPAITGLPEKGEESPAITGLKNGKSRLL